MKTTVLRKLRSGTDGQKQQFKDAARSPSGCGTGTGGFAALGKRREEMVEESEPTVKARCQQLTSRGDESWKRSIWKYRCLF